MERRLTREQRSVALVKAGEAKTARLDLLAALKCGESTFPQVVALAKTDSVVGGTKVAQLLQALPGYGPTRVTTLLKDIGIDANGRAAELGEPQTAALLEALVTGG